MYTYAEPVERNESAIESLPLKFEEVFRQCGNTYSIQRFAIP